MKTTIRQQFFLLLALLLAGVNSASAQFARGDVNGDGVVDITDVTVLRSYLHSGTFPKVARTVSFSEASVTKTFGDTAFTNAATPSAGAGEGTLSYESSETGVATVDATTGEVTIAGAGSTTITASITAGDTYAAASNTYTLTVTPAAASFTAPVAVTAELTYTGDEQALVTEGSTADGTMRYFVNTTGDEPSTSTDGWTTTVPKQTDAGTYYVWYYVKGDANHNDTEVTAIAGNSKTIEKANATYTAPVYSSLTYNGESQDLVSAGSTEHGIITYATSADGEYNTTIPTGTAADSYTVWYKLTGDGNHNDVAATEVTGVSIAKKSVTVTGITAADKTYDTTADATLDYTAVSFAELLSGDELSVTATGTFSDANAGTGKTVTITGLALGGASVGNYKLADEGNQTSTTANITAAAATITADAIQSTTYNTNAQPLTASVSAGSFTVTYYSDAEHTTGETTTAPTNAGTYYAVVTQSNGNYASDDVYVTYTINRATPTVTAPTANTLTYNGEAQTLVAEGAAVNGEIQYCLEKEGIYSTTLPVGTNAGSYTVWYKVAGHTNYNDVASQSIVVSIAKASGSISYEATVLNKLTTDEAFTNLLTQTPTIGEGLGTVTYSLSGDEIANINISTGEVTLNGTTGTATITATVTDGENYAYSPQTATYILKVVSRSIKQNPLWYVAKGNMKGSTIMASDGMGGLFYSWSVAMSNFAKMTNPYAEYERGEKTISGEEGTWHMPIHAELWSIVPHNYGYNFMEYVSSTNPTSYMQMSFSPVFGYNEDTKDGIDESSYFVYCSESELHAIRFLGTDYCSAWRYKWYGSGTVDDPSYLEISATLIDKS